MDPETNMVPPACKFNKEMNFSFIIMTSKVYEKSVKKFWKTQHQLTHDLALRVWANSEFTFSKKKQQQQQKKQNRPFANSFQPYLKWVFVMNISFHSYQK